MNKIGAAKRIIGSMTLCLFNFASSRANARPLCCRISVSVSRLDLRLDVHKEFGLLSAQQFGWVVRSSHIVDPLHICSDWHFPVGLSCANARAMVLDQARIQFQSMAVSYGRDVNFKL